MLPVVALALLPTGAAAAASAPRTAVAPLSLAAGSELNGFIALGGSDKGQRLRFLPNRKFAAGLVLQNDSQVRSSSRRGRSSTRPAHGSTP